MRNWLRPNGDNELGSMPWDLDNLLNALRQSRTYIILTGLEEKKEETKQRPAKIEKTQGVDMCTANA